MRAPPEIEQHIERAVAEIAADRTRGASELARRSLELLAACAEHAQASQASALRAGLAELGRRLAVARPGMAAVENLVAAWLAELERAPEGSTAALRRHAAGCARALQRRSLEAVAGTARHAAKLVGCGDTIITHSLSSTVRALFAELTGRGVRAIVTESRPLYEGRALAQTLAGLGIETCYITDAQAGRTWPWSGPTRCCGTARR